MQLRESVGPTTMAEILKRAGVPAADANILATEPPMETMVTDNIDKPDADAQGPGREANDLSEVAKIMVEADTANASAQLTNAQSQASHEQTHTHAQTAHAQRAELHGHAVRKAAAEADLAERRAKEPAADKGEPAEPKKK